ncbi:hypothetical protein PQQ84_05700 [Paraburkholderia strydomiana]|uniref:hypothetical protein n=1 Tax=Paraburkholderia strydomiana TaxID=1245417 RepID=UPI0038B91938
MTRVAYSQFCDDVRAELGNKLSVMGIYSGEIIVPSAPFVLARLCCVAACMTPVERPFSSLAFRLAVDGTEIARGEIPEEQLKATMEHVRSKVSGPDPISRISASMTLLLSPYMVTAPHIIKAYAIADGEELPAGRLYVTVHNPEISHPT